jgi:hypothetical protein
MNFQKGDEIRCVNVENYSIIDQAQLYTVKTMTSYGVELEGIEATYPPHLFKLHSSVNSGSNHGVGMPADNNGGSSDHYKLPPTAKDLQDLIEDRKMSFAQGNIFKAAYRMGFDGRESKYDLNKIIWFAQRMLNECG